VQYLINGKKILQYDNRTSRKKKRIAQVKGKDGEEESAPFRHIDFVDKDLMAAPLSYEDVERMDQFLERAVEQHEFKTFAVFRSVVGHEEPKESEKKDDKKKHPTPKYGKKEQLSYGEVHQKVVDLSNNMIGKLGIKSGDKVALYMDTCPEWMISCHACFRKGIVVTTLFASLSEEGAVSALKETEPTAIIIQAKALIGEKKQKFMSILKNIDTVTLKNIIVIDRELLEKDQKTYNEAKRSLEDIYHVTVSSLKELTEESEEAETKLPKDDLAMIMYTSGTTGKPKGVEITHKNMLAAIGALDYAVDLKKETVEDSISFRYMAYLPLAHILELVAEHIIMYRGGTLCYGTAHSLTGHTGDLNTFKPTVMVGVPKVFDTIVKAAKEKLKKSPSLLQGVVNAALWYKMNFAERFHTETPLWKSLLFDRVFRPLVGGKVKMIMSGGAALNKDSHRFIRAIFDVPVIQGYGLTETTASCALMSPNNDCFRTSTVGAILPCCEIKLVDKKEAGYTHKDKPNPRGVIKIRGPSIFRKYFKEPEKTEEALQDGWFDTVC
jgi:long-chain acyl-CoA synthetase